ncbi:MAG: glutamate-5-semialdehyde dehydrogenase [Thermoanaerobaculia bacterium]
MSDEIRLLAESAKGASRRLAALRAPAKDAALEEIAARLEADAETILGANAADVEEAVALVSRGELAEPLLARLKLDPGKLAAMVDGVRSVARLEDPSGRLLAKTLLDDGLVLEKVSCPLGVLAVVFESRPDAVTQISALAVKSGNAVILKGGRESARSTAALVAAIRAGLAAAGLPEDAVQSVAGRSSVDALLALDDLVDLVVPRGSNALVRSIRERTRIPVLGHAEGLCHVYVDAAANPEMAVSIVLDAKLTYPAACNAVETVLVHTAAVPDVMLPLLGSLLEKGVEVRGCEETRAAAHGLPVVPATEDDWRTEYGAPVVSVKVIGSLDEAIAHVNRFGSGHTEAIVTDDRTAAERFLAGVDAAGVYHNASTRFADGYRYGLGAEVGIATGKLHARGPVGLEGLVTYRWLLRGHGQSSAAYGPGGKPFRHEKLPVP